MWRAELSVMRALATAVALLVLPSCAAAQQGVADFAERVRKIVVLGDVSAFSELPCYPAPCIDQEDTDFVIGPAESKSFIREFLENPRVKIKIFGPYTYDDETGEKSYLVMFYDPDLVKFNSEGQLSQEERERLWWKGYIETVVSPVNSGWGFHRTPFYYGTEAPWTEDF